MQPPKSVITCRGQGANPVAARRASNQENQEVVYVKVNFCWQYSLPDTVGFTSHAAFTRSIRTVDFSKFYSVMMYNY